MQTRPRPARCALGHLLRVYTAPTPSTSTRHAPRPSLLELGLISGSGVSALRSLRSLRVLKSFRVLRVVKMFRYMESLQQIARVLITSLNSFAAIVVLLGLFWLVFSIVGLHVLGGIKLETPGWPNCDTLINSAVMNFHVRLFWCSRAPGRRSSGDAITPPPPLPRPCRHSTWRTRR